MGWSRSLEESNWLPSWQGNNKYMKKKGPTSMVLIMMGLPRALQRSECEQSAQAEGSSLHHCITFVGQKTKTD